MTTATRPARTRKSDPLLFLLAGNLLHQLDHADAQYEADVVEWNTTGRGVTHGYTYPACRHGASRWTDYDNICGPCKDGYSNMEIALAQAGSCLREFQRRSEIIKPIVHCRDHSFDHTVTKPLLDWAWAAIESALKRPDLRPRAGRLP